MTSPLPIRLLNLTSAAWYVEWPIRSPPHCPYQSSHIGDRAYGESESAGDPFDHRILRYQRIKRRVQADDGSNRSTFASACGWGCARASSQQDSQRDCEEGFHVFDV